jgi:hypothetical protein
VSADSLFALRRLAAQREPEERCELCGAGIGAEHRHLLDIKAQTLVCSCRACSLLFFGGEPRARYRLVPTRVLSLPGFRLEDHQWEDLAVPVNLAFFMRSTPADRVVALYPSPAGATESQLGLEAWQQLEADNPILSQLEPDVEALLVNRVRGAGEYFIAPIDECYRLVGLVRSGWRGLSGGSEVWAAIGQFFADLKGRAKTR